MAENLDCAPSNLLCAENTNTCFGDLDYNAINKFGISPSQHPQHNQTESQDPFLVNNRSGSLMGYDFPVPSEERVREMVESEIEHLPGDDYLKRLRSGDLDLRVRREALDWIWKACAYYHFGPLSVCLSVNYLDRFLSLYELPKGKTWTGQLLAVACLLVAAKMEETKVPLSVDLQVGEPKFFFEAKTIQRMELLVLSTLRWKMHAFSPCSFIDYFLSKIGDDHYPSPTFISRSVQLILSTMKGIDFLEFRPSEIAAGVAISVSGTMQAVDIDKAISGFVHVKKERVLKCVELMKDLSLISGSVSANNVGSTPASSVPQSPNGVLDATCLSYRSDDITVGSCANSSHCNQDSKRRKQDNKPPSHVEFRS